MNFIHNQLSKNYCTLNHEYVNSSSVLIEQVDFEEIQEQTFKIKIVLQILVQIFQKDDKSNSHF